LTALGPWTIFWAAGSIGLMNKRSPSLLGVLMILALAASWAHPREAAAEGRLNVLIITIDTLRPDRLGCYASPYLKTPNIDGLAEKGILFTRAFAHTPTTLASHTNILLGTTPPFHGVRANANFVVPKDSLTLAAHLKGFGYATGAIVGGYPLDSSFGLSQGFDTYDDDFAGPGRKKSPLLERKAEVVVSKALSWLETRSSPWFLWIHCYDPHDPYEPPAPFRDRYDKQPYDGEVAYVDLALARLFSYLEENGLYGKTLIVLTGDHGESLGQHGELTHGYLAYNTTLWVPLIIASPGLRPGKVDESVGHIDIFPTICDMLGLVRPSSLQGVSLRQGMEGRSWPRRPIYFESMDPYYRFDCAPLSGFIEGREKFIESPLPELYSLETDPDERVDLSGRRELAGYRQELDRIVRSLTGPKGHAPEGRIDRDALEKLKSLGYVSAPGPREPRKGVFGRDDDVKIFLPFYNRSLQAMELHKRGKGDEAVALLTRLIDERKNFALAYYDLALIQYQRGKLEEAVSVLELGMKRVPGDYALFFNLISYLVAARRYDEVIATVKISRFQAMENDPGVWLNLGVAYSGKGDLESARTSYEKALSLDDKNATIWNDLAANYLQLSQRKKDPFLFSRSIESFKKSIELDPDYQSPYEGLGNAYRSAGNLEGAIFCWEKALQLDPGSGRTLYSLGLAYYDKGETTKALDHLGRYQERFGPGLSPGEKKELEELIRKCRQ
jgi:arylsulfatase A-like enzyme/tetratricopeptide (TPR) repeat protein